MLLACPVAAFFMIGAAGKEWFEQHLPPESGADGSVTVPTALRPYMNGLERIEPKP